MHRADCPNLVHAEKGRLIDVYWDYTNITEKRFEVDIEIEGLDRPNLLNDIITVLGQVKVNILNINANVEDTEAKSNSDYLLKMQRYYNLQLIT